MLGFGNINSSSPFPVGKPPGRPHLKPENNSPAINNGNSVKPEGSVPSGMGVKSMGEMRTNKASSSNPSSSQGITNVQGAMAEKVTGEKVPYNRLTLSDGRQIDVNIGDELFKSFDPNISKEDMEKNRRYFIDNNKEKMTKMLNSQKDNLPKDMKSINMTADYQPISMDPTKKDAHFDMNYDPGKKVLNVPAGRFQKSEAEFAAELKDATNPALYNKKKSLEKLGIKWSDNNNQFTASQEIELMNTLENVASKVKPEKRPKNVDIGLVERAPLEFSGMGITGGNALGSYNCETNQLKLMKKGTDGKELPMDTLKANLIHEYGHATADTNKKGPDGIDTFAPIRDSKGRNITERAEKLEKSAEAKGYNPADPGADKTIFDKYDPYVDSHGLKDRDGNIVKEKYSRYNKDEHYAEAFREYANSPERFRGKMKEMEGKLEGLKEGSPEYNYLKESLDIRKESYNYFKNQIFGGYEFGK